MHWAKHQSFDTSITVGVSSLERTVELAEKHIEDGFSILKIKIGDCVDEDIERMKALFALKPEKIKKLGLMPTEVIQKKS